MSNSPEQSNPVELDREIDAFFVAFPDAAEYLRDCREDLRVAVALVGLTTLNKAGAGES